MFTNTFRKSDEADVLRCCSRDSSSLTLPSRFVRLSRDVGKRRKLDQLRSVVGILGYWLAVTVSFAAKDLYSKISARSIPDRPVWTYGGSMYDMTENPRSDNRFSQGPQ